MKKFFMIVALVAMSLGMADAATVQNASDKSTVALATTSAVEYTGTLSNVTMNGNLYSNVENVIFKIYDGQLIGKIGKIGKMPGTISIEMSVTIASDGTITSTSGTKAGTLKFSFGGSTTLYVQSLTGNVSDGTLHFTLATYGSFLGIKAFPASVTFDGTTN